MATTEKVTRQQRWHRKGLTAKAIERLKPAAERCEIKDGQTPGLYLRIEPSGRKTWRYRYKIDGRVRILSLGAWPAVDLGKARTRAWLHREEVRAGDDPAATAQAAAAEKRRMPTVEVFLNEYIERYAKPRKKTWKADEQMLRRWLLPSLGRQKMNKVTRRDIAAVIDAVRDAGNTRQPGKVLAATRRMFRFAVERGVLEQSPVVYITERQPSPARRAMDIETARKWWEKTGEALAEPVPRVHRSAALALRLLLLTGQRPGEVAGAAVADFDLAERVWNIPAERRKHGKAHAVALTDEAVAVVEAALPMARGGWLFPKNRHARDEPSRSERLARALKELLGTDGPTPHAARHTVATELEALGLDELEIARVLGHQSSSVTGRVYINRRSLGAQRRALEAWGRRLLGQGGAEIVSLRGNNA